MKITIIGGGSLFFSRRMLMGMMELPAYRGAELALVETDPWRCEQIGRYAQRLNNETGRHVTVSCTTERRDVLAGSDYVILTFSNNNAHSRGVGAHICRNYGIIECSGDTAGPGSVMRVIREVPAILEVARDIEQLAPTARVMNYVNPTNVIAAALDRYTSLNWTSLCDGMYPRGLAPRLCKYLGVEPTDENRQALKLEVSGINHFVWMTGLTLGGQDVFGRFADALRADAMANPAGDARSEWDLMETFGAWPAVIWHTKEYVRYFQGRGSRPQRDFVVTPWDLGERLKWQHEAWRTIADYAAGRITLEQAAGDSHVSRREMLVDIIEAMIEGRREPFPVNVRNSGRVSNLPDDCIVELFGTTDPSGFDVPPAGDLPLGIRAMVYQALDQQELALEAAMTGSFELAARAIACDPLVMSLSDARQLTHELLAAENDYLPPAWEEYWKQQ